ncbi:pilus assembly protein PilM [Psychrobacter lutiphocae]|uniref:pilus assembly protein PilM n=1 Tax=Psychrobacter lutiphocae TaxID=540500 RepID=UPI0003827659|nr:pilus assembly protein PilM [Psychrobacter lutiphocae]
MRLLPAALSSTTSILGISISNTAVSMVALSQQHSHYQLTHYGITELSGAEMVDNEIIDVEQMGYIVAELMQRLHLQPTQAATAIAQALTLTKHLTMPAWLSEAEIEAQIYIDAEQYIPYPIAEASFDFEVLRFVATAHDQNIQYNQNKANSGNTNSNHTNIANGNSRANGNGSEAVTVLLVASLSHHIEQLIDTFRFADIKPQFIEADNHAIERAWQLICQQPSSYPAVVALIDIGHSRTRVYVAHQGIFVYQNEQLFGGSQLTESLQTNYLLNTGQAQQVKTNWPEKVQDVNIDNLDKEYVAQHLMPFADSLVDHIKQALQAYFQPQPQISQSTLDNQQHPSQIEPKPILDSAPQIEQVVLCGGSAALSQLDLILQDKLGLPVSIANPFDGMSIRLGIDKQQLQQDAPRLMTACGLSLRACQSVQHSRKRGLWRK